MEAAMTRDSHLASPSSTRGGAQLWAPHGLPAVPSHLCPGTTTPSLRPPDMGKQSPEGRPEGWLGTKTPLTLISSAR